MKTIWAPWRISYLTQSTEGAVKLKSKQAHKKTNAKKIREMSAPCPFCDAAQMPVSSETLVLKKGRLAYVIMNKYPYANGHLMVIPLRHIASFEDLTPAEHKEIGDLISRSVQVLKKYGLCDGFNIGMNLGQAAGAGILGHIHYHVVPRWQGDHNFMPVLADVRVVPEHMLATYEKLKKIF